MAPDGPLPSQSLITKQFVHWMFGNAGPFGPRLIDVGSNQDVVAGLAAIRGSGRPVGASRAQDDGIALPKPPKYPLPTWRLVPDAFLLVNLLIRTSQFDSLEFALERLLGMFPSLRPNTCMAPLTTWSHFRLDNRSRLQLDTAFMAHLNGDVHMSCSTYLCILALWDWSLPAITIIERIFTAEHINLTAVARQTISEFSIFRGMLSTLTHLGPSEPCMSNRVLSVLNWLHSHDAFVDSNLIPLVSVFIQNNYPTFANVFLEHDAPKLEHLPIGPGNHHFDFLGDLIATFALEGHTSVLQVALERQLLSEPVKKRLLSKAAKNPGKKWAAEVFRCLAKDGDVAAKVLRVFYR